MKFKNLINEISESKSIKYGIYALGALVVLFFVFQAGMIAGFRKASFGRDWGDNYTNNFGSPHKFLKLGGDLGDFGNLPNAHGAIGKIIKVELPTIVVFDGKDQTEKIILINDQTKIMKGREVVDQIALKVDEHVIVLGQPNTTGQIEAKLIRFIPVPPAQPIK